MYRLLGLESVVSVSSMGMQSITLFSQPRSLLVPYVVHGWLGFWQQTGTLIQLLVGKTRLDRFQLVATRYLKQRTRFTISPASTSIAEAAFSSSTTEPQPPIAFPSHPPSTQRRQQRQLPPPRHRLSTGLLQQLQAYPFTVQATSQSTPLRSHQQLSNIVPLLRKTQIAEISFCS